MTTFKIEISEDVKQKLIQDGLEELEELEGYGNWISYINESFALQSEELMRVVYADKRNLATLQKKQNKSPLELEAENAFRVKWESENPAKKLSRIATDHLLARQRKALSSQDNENKSRSIWALWMRFADLLNARLITLGEEGVIDKQAFQQIQNECESYVFDHPQQLLADLSFLDGMGEELREGILSVSYLHSKEVTNYRNELKRVLGKVESEKTKIIKTLSHIKIAVSQGNTKNIANEIKEIIDSVFENAMHVPVEKWSEKELSIIQQIKTSCEKIFPSKITSKSIYTLKDYVDICQVISPLPTFVSRDGRPIEIEKIPAAKSSYFSYFHQGQDALFELFSNTKVKDLSRAFQDLEALQVLSLENPELIDVITQELPTYRNSFMSQVDNHKRAVEQKIQTLSEDFFTRFIAEKEILELKKWLETLNRFSYQADDIAQTLFLKSMAYIPKTPEKALQIQKEKAEKNHALVTETQKLFETSQKLHEAYRRVVNVQHLTQATAIATEETKVDSVHADCDSTENKKRAKESHMPPPKPAKRIPQNMAALLTKPKTTGNIVPEVSGAPQALHHIKTENEYAFVNAKHQEVEKVGLTPEERRKALLRTCKESHAENLNLGEETERLAQNLRQLKEKRQGLMEGDSQNKARQETAKMSLVSQHSNTNPNRPVFTKDFSKTLANVCVARGEAMRKTYFSSQGQETQSSSLPKASATPSTNRL
jgi:hypothetical protein